MLIFSMTATFGCFNNETLRLHDGLNILEEANEGGKSTWCAFLRAMFYGLESRKGGANSEKNRYTPWSGAAMRGEMELSWAGQHITLFRFPKGSNPFGGFKAVYTGTEEPVPGLSGDNVGETILGVSKEVFQRTCFLPQGGIQIDGSADLEKRVAALATSGQEDVSFSQTERRLKDWRNALQSNRSTGTLPKKRERLMALRQILDKGQVLRERVADAQGYLEDLKRQKAEIEEDLALHQVLQEQSYARRYDKARQELQQKEADYAQRFAQLQGQGTLPGQEELRKAQGDLAYLNALEERKKSAAVVKEQLAQRRENAQKEANASPFAPMTAQEAHQEAQRIYAILTSPARTRVWHWVPMLGCGVAALALIVVGLVTKAIHPAILLGVGGGLLVAGVVVSLALSAGGKKQRTKETAELLARFQIRQADEVLGLEKLYEKSQTAWQEAEAAYAQAVDKEEELEQEYDALWADLRAFCLPFAPQADSPITLSAALSRSLAQEGLLAQAKSELEQAKAVFEAVASQGEPTQTPEEGSSPLPQRERSEDEAILVRLNHALALYSEQLARSQGELTALGDLTAVEEERKATEEAIARQEEQYTALTLALETLTQANATLQSRFSPAVNQTAGEIMARLTGGRYSALSFTRDFQALADSGLGLHGSQFLSQGTADQVYLALRLAICQLTFFQEELPPLVLDDALVTFDDQRLGYALELFSQLSRDRQVILFTCQSRERQAARRLNTENQTQIDLS